MPPRPTTTSRDALARPRHPRADALAEEDAVTATYDVIEADRLRSGGALVAAAGAVFLLVIGLLGSEWLVGLAVCALVWVLGGLHVAGQVYEVRVGADGTVEFVRLRGRLRVAADEVRAIEDRWSRDEDGDVYHRLRVRHAGGRIDVGYFPRAEEFVAQVRALNPAVATPGRWPPVDVPPAAIGPRRGTDAHEGR
jgi:hypothetical protein